MHLFPDLLELDDPAVATTLARLFRFLPASDEDDLGPFELLLDAITQPFDERPGLEPYAEPAPGDFGGAYRTFCGT